MIWGPQPAGCRKAAGDLGNNAMTDEQQYSERTLDLVEKNPVISCATVFRHGGPDAPNVCLAAEDLVPDDFIKYEGSGFNVGNALSVSMGPDHYECYLKAINGWNTAFEALGDRVARVNGTADIDAVMKSGKLGLCLGTHGAEHFRTLGDVDMFYEMGQRHALLINNLQCQVGSGVLDEQDGGLTDYGKDLIRHMNDIGMLIDLAHSSERSLMEACATTSKPVITSHGNCLALAANIRNEPDEVIKALAGTGGLMGIAPLRMLVTAEEPTTLDDFLNHIEHVAEVAGVEHAALGLDGPIEGWDSLPPENQIPLPPYMQNEGVQRVLDIPEICNPKGVFNITERMVTRGWSDEDIRAILGGNLRRVLDEVWAA